MSTNPFGPGVLDLEFCWLTPAISAPLPIASSRPFVDLSSELDLR